MKRGSRTQVTVEVTNASAARAFSRGFGTGDSLPDLVRKLLTHEIPGIRVTDCSPIGDDKPPYTDPVAYPENDLYGCIDCGSINHTTGDATWCLVARAALERATAADEPEGNDHVENDEIDERPKGKTGSNGVSKHDRHLPFALFGEPLTVPHPMAYASLTVSHGFASAVVIGRWVADLVMGGWECFAREQGPSGVIVWCRRPWEWVPS